MPPPQGTTKRTAEKAPTRTGRSASVRAAARQARCAAAAAGARRAHRARRPPLPRAQLSSRQPGRTSRVRQDDGARAVGRTRPSRIRLGLARPSRQRSGRLSDVRRRGVERRLDGRPWGVQGARGLRRLAVGAWGPAPRLGAGCAGRAARPGPRRRARAREPRLPRRPGRTAPPRAARVAAGALRPC